MALIVIGSLLTPVAVAGSWARNELLDTDRFVALFAPLARDAGMQAALTGQIMAVIDENIDVPSIASDAIDGVTSLGTGSAATLALNAMKGPAAAALQSFVQTRVESFVESETFAGVWAGTLRVSHAQLVATMADTPGSVVSLDGDGIVGIQIGPIVEAVKTELVAQGLTFVASLPTIERTIPIARSDVLLTVRNVYGLASFAGAWLPWLAFALLLAGIAAGRRRAVVAIGAAGSVAVTMIIAGVLLSIGGTLFVSAVSPAALSSDAARALFDTVSGSLGSVGDAVLGAAVVAGLAVTAWLVLRPSVRLQRRFRREPSP